MLVARSSNRCAAITSALPEVSYNTFPLVEILLDVIHKLYIITISVHLTQMCWFVKVKDVRIMAESEGIHPGHI